MAWFSTKALGNTVQTPYPVLSLLQHKKTLKTKRKLMGLHINSNSWYQVDNHIIFEIFECLKHSQYWRKPCITIVICLLTESNHRFILYFTYGRNIYSVMNLDLHNHMLKRKKKNWVEVACYLSTALPAGNTPSIVCSLRDSKAEESA